MMEEIASMITSGCVRRTMDWLGHTIRRLGLSMMLSIALHIALAAIVVLILMYSGEPRSSEPPGISVNLAGFESQALQSPRGEALEGVIEDAYPSIDLPAEHLEREIQRDAEEQFGKMSEEIIAHADQLAAEELAALVARQEAEYKNQQAKRKVQIGDILEASEEKASATTEKAAKLKEALAGTFYGLAPGDARKMVYVVDHSSSMTHVFPSVQTELKLAVSSLTEKKYFHIIFFSDGPISEMTGRQLVQATAAQKKNAIDFINGIGIGSGTNPKKAMERAFQIEPELIYFLTDGQFDASVVDYILQFNRAGKVTINTIGFGDPKGQRVLKSIAEQNKGRFRTVK